MLFLYLGVPAINGYILSDCYARCQENVPQLAVDERMVALFRIIDPDIESSGKHIDECRQIDPRAVDAAYGSREMQCRFQFHDIRRRELFGEEQRRFRDFDRYRGGDGRITKPGKD